MLYPMLSVASDSNPNPMISGLISRTSPPVNPRAAAPEEPGGKAQASGAEEAEQICDHHSAALQSVPVQEAPVRRPKTRS